MKNYVGRKIRGFMFEETKKHWWRDSLKKYIGVIGEIEGVSMDNIDVVVRFPNDTIPYRYPISLIEPHLIEEEIPEIIDLSNIEGVKMMVKDQRDDTPRKVIIKATVNNRFIDWCGNVWYYAEPIPQLPKYTHAELVEKIGHDFEII